LLEKIVDSSFQNESYNEALIEKLSQFHLKIANNLFDKDHAIFKEVFDLIEKLKKEIVSYSDRPFDFYYDQIVTYGELLSTRIIFHYLKQEHIKTQWVEAGELIKTNSNYREGKVEWEKCLVAAKNYSIEKEEVLLTQGFLGRSDEDFVITLGREGSDYTAAILAYIFDANELIIWKDVPGMLNADPRHFSSTQKLNEISFKEAIELSYYGATVIHPKTLQPLKEKNLPLFVKSFLERNEPGSKIGNNEAFDHDIPSYILKEKQVLISISPHDLTFVVEENLSHIFSIFSKAKVKIHLMQNSALNFSVCIGDDKRKIPSLIEALREDYRVLFNTNLSLLTLRHYNETLLKDLIKNKEILLEQKTRFTARFVYR
jgi:aspartate kinase